MPEVLTVRRQGENTRAEQSRGLPGGVPRHLQTEPQSELAGGAHHCLKITFGPERTGLQPRAGGHAAAPPMEFRRPQHGPSGRSPGREGRVRGGLHARCPWGARGWVSLATLTPHPARPPAPAHATCTPSAAEGVSLSFLGSGEGLASQGNCVPEKTATGCGRDPKKSWCSQEWRLMPCGSHSGPAAA